MHTEMWALNFRDALVAAGAIPMDTNGTSLGLGGECYGVVTRTGEGVTSVAVGDRVVGVPPAGMGSWLVTEERWVMRAADGVGAEDAVSGTMVYATAWLGLHLQARISAGDTVLIHSAAGGVGLAATHLCLRAGCIVYATASTDQKRSLLLSLGAAAVFDSRNPTSFAAGIREATGGAGVDVVLNSLAGDAAATSLGLLKPFGRFVEIGKRDAYEGGSLPMAPFLRGLSYSTAHLDVLMLEQPEAARALLQTVAAALPSLPSLPVTDRKSVV